MKLKWSIITIIIVGFISLYFAFSFFEEKVKLKSLIGFQNEPSIETELNIEFYEHLNKFKKQENLNFKNLSYLFSLLNIQGDSVRFRFKGDIYLDSSITIGSNKLTIESNDSNRINYSNPEEVVIVNKNNDKQASKVFQAVPLDVCSVTMIIYQDNKATYLTTEDSFGIYLGNEDTMDGCQKNVKNDINILNPLPIGIKDKNVKKAKKLANLLNDIKDQNQLNNVDISKMIGISNIDIGNKELKYSEPYLTNNLTISHNSYQLAGDDNNKSIISESDSNPKMIVLSTNRNNQTKLLGTAELNKINDLKLIIYKQGSSYVYDLNNMKHRTIMTLPDTRSYWSKFVSKINTKYDLKCL